MFTSAHDLCGPDFLESKLYFITCVVQAMKAIKVNLFGAGIPKAFTLVVSTSILNYMRIFLFRVDICALLRQSVASEENLLLLRLSLVKCIKNHFVFILIVRCRRRYNCTRDNGRMDLRLLYYLSSKLT